MAVLIRMDPDVLQRLRQRAQQKRVGYSTYINDVLAAWVALRGTV